MDSNPLIIEARARIIWGESSDSVRDYLISGGMSETEADAKIKELNRERNQEIRGRGLRDTIIGAGILAATSLLLYAVFTSPHIPIVTGRRAGGAIGGLILAAGYGIWKLVNGIINLVRPQSDHESIPDM